MTVDIDHEFTRNIICPYCGYEDEDSWETEPDEQGCLGSIACGKCGREFKAYRYVDVTYSTEAMKGE